MTSLRTMAMISSAFSYEQTTMRRASILRYGTSSPCVICISFDLCLSLLILLLGWWNIIAVVTAKVSFLITVICSSQQY